MKRFLSLFFDLLATIIILAHAFIPHHHHQDSIHFVTTHHEHDNSIPDGQHNNVHEYWLLTITKARIGGDKHSNQSIDFNYSIDLSPYIIALFSDITKPLISDDGLLIDRSYLRSCHIEFISQSLGLRAPPAC